LTSQKKVGFSNGVLQKLVVYDNGAIIGHGHIIILANGNMGLPTLLDFKGNELPAGLYQLQVTDEKHYVVVPKRIQ
jgi:hypothetical protein